MARIGDPRLWPAAYRRYQMARPGPNRKAQMMDEMTYDTYGDSFYVGGADAGFSAPSTADLYSSSFSVGGSEIVDYGIEPATVSFVGDPSYDSGTNVLLAALAEANGAYLPHSDGDQYLTDDRFPSDGYRW